MSVNTSKRNILICACAVVFMSNGGVILSPALAKIIAAFPNVPEVYSQMLITVPGLMMVPSAVISGYLSRRFSAKSIFLVCLALIGVAGVFPYFISNFPLIFVSRILVGVGIGAMLPIASSMIANNFTGIEKARAMGLYTAIGSFAGAGMTLLSGIVVNYGWKYNFLIYLLVVAELIAVAISCPKSNPIDDTLACEIKTSDNEKVLNKSVIYVWLVFFFYMGFLYSYPQNIALFVQGENIGTSSFSGLASALFLLSGFFSGMVYGMATKIFKKYVLSAGLIITAMGILFLSKANGPVVVIISSCLCGIGMNMVLPTGSLLSAASVPPIKAASAVAVATTGYQLAQFLSTFMVNYPAALVYGAGNIRGRYSLSGLALCLLAGLITIITFARQRGADA